MTEPSSSAQGGFSESHGDSRKPVTTAAFSPHSHTSATQSRSTILLHQKSPLLLATPPQVTRALAYSHAFVVPLNKLVGLLSWTTGDPWESFLMVAAFWFAVLYGSTVLRYTGPLILVVFLILGMYFRRYSPLSSTGWTGEKKKSHQRTSSDSVQHRKSLDEILATLQAFTGRCNILLAPMIQMTDFLSTQQTATSATTRPALTTLFIRILLATPVWALLTLPPLRIITSKRIVFVTGTTVLSWHSRPARISRAILWRSRTVRHLVSLLTGLNFETPSAQEASKQPITPASNIAALKDMKSRNQSIRFTFSLYENQRRWIGLGWTSNMVAYERAPWTDEHLNPTPAPEKFTLPDIEGGFAKWRWTEGSKWRVDVSQKSSGSKDGDTRGSSKAEEEAWIYYDNKWLYGTRGQDGWSKYTRRRKWVRDAELIDVNASDTDTSGTGPAELDASPPELPPRLKRAAGLETGTDQNATIKPQHKKRHSHTGAETLSPEDASVTGNDAASTTSSARNRRSWFGRNRGDSDGLTINTVIDEKVKDKLRKLSPNRHRRGDSNASTASRQRGESGSSLALGLGGWDAKEGKEDGDTADGADMRSPSGSSKRRSMDAGSSRSRRRDEGQDVLTPTERLRAREADWGLGDDVSMELG